ASRTTSWVLGVRASRRSWKPGKAASPARRTAASELLPEVRLIPRASRRDAGIPSLDHPVLSCLGFCDPPGRSVFRGGFRPALGEGETSTHPSGGGAVADPEYLHDHQRVAGAR